MEPILATYKNDRLVNPPTRTVKIITFVRGDNYTEAVCVFKDGQIASIPVHQLTVIKDSK